ncbi:GntR family transcriptional regulator [Aquibaculum sediminis]|uniref:GntR family transcriptional regulator n=1 Tax=Aquibaculum sediminis TaxID=3231907 RepID=UPI003456D61D
MPQKPSSTAVRVSAEDLRRNRVPLYVQLADIMRRRISDGTWPLGERIPTLNLLVAEFGVARITVRQALTILEQEGLVARYRAKGSFAVKRPPSERWLRLRTDVHSLESVVLTSDTRFLACHPAADPPELDEEDGRAAEAYQFLRREISRDGIRYALVDVHLARHLFDSYDLADLERRTITTMLQEDPTVGPMDGHQTLTIASADAETSKLMDMPLNAPIALVRRVLRSADGTAIYVAHATYRGEFVRLDIALS